MKKFDLMPMDARNDYHWRRSRTLTIATEPDLVAIQWNDLSSGWNVPEKKITVSDGEYSLDFLAEDYSDKMIDDELHQLMKYAKEVFARQRRLKARIA